MANTYAFPPHTKGDTANSITFTINVNDSPLDLTGATARMDLRSTTGDKLKRFSIGSVLTILNPPTDGKLMFDQQVVDVSAGKHNYDIEITLSGAVVKTYIKGTWIILPEQTYD
jgi:hypothetical protein